MFLQMNREALLVTVRSVLPNAKIKRVKHPEYGDGGDIWINSNQSISFDELENGQCDIRACDWENNQVVGTQDFMTEEELISFIKSNM